MHTCLVGSRDACESGDMDAVTAAFVCTHCGSLTGVDVMALKG